MKPVVVSYYTLGTPYEGEALEMQATARAFGLFTDVRGVPNLGTWVGNCAFKSAFIRDRMKDYPGRPIVWLDADARVRRKPELFETLDCDFAAHWRYGEELLSGTLYLAPSLEAKELVLLWCEWQRRCPGEWDQKVLQSVIDANIVKSLRIERLPATFTRIFDDASMGEPVIEHMQKSRAYRNVV